MSDETNQRITITNIKSGETVYHPLVLLKGIIEHVDNCNESSKATMLTCSNNHSPKSKNNTRPPKTSFKILIELKPGENIVNVDFCCSSLNMKLSYCKRKSPCTVVPMYIINEGHCGKFQAPDTEDNSPESACKRILTGCKLLQCLIAEKLHEEGLGRKTFQIEDNECVIFHSNLHYKVARTMEQEDLWSYLGREVMNSKIGSENKKYLGFLSCTKYNGDTKLIQSYEDMIKVTEGHIALGGGGLALFGSACLYTWPQNVDEVVARFEDDTIVDKRKFMDDSCYRGTYGTCFTTTLGSVVHELCHTFDLGHTRDGIMDRGFDNIHKFFTTDRYRPLDVDEKYSEIKSKFIQASLTISAAMNSNGIIRNPTCVQEDIIRKRNNDDTYFTRSCSFLLFYHKYFNDYPNQNSRYILKFDMTTNFVKSTVGIRVIEIRKKANEIVDYCWMFPGKILKYSFQIPEDCFSDKDIIIVVEDNSGNILKEYYEK